MRRVALALAAVGLTSPAMAQDVSADWDLTTDPARQVTLATLNFGSNQIALRCKTGVLDFLLTGVPTTVASPAVTVTAGAIQNERQQWLAWPDQPIISPPEPARFARQLRAVG